MTKTWSHFYRQTYDVEYLIQNTFYHLKMFNRILKESPKKILEVGTGTGLMSIFLSYLGFKVTALDNDQNILKKAQNSAKKLNGKVQFVLGDAFKMPFKNKAFDVVFHQGLLEHFEDQEIFELLDEQLRVGKKVVLSIPNKFYPSLDLGDERLLPDEYWNKLLSQKYQLLFADSYFPRRKTLFGDRIGYCTINTMFLAEISQK